MVRIACMRHRQFGIGDLTDLTIVESCGGDRIGSIGNRRCEEERLALGGRDTRCVDDLREFVWENSDLEGKVSGIGGRKSTDTLTIGRRDIKFEARAYDSGCRDGGKIGVGGSLWHHGECAVVAALAAIGELDSVREYKRSTGVGHCHANGERGILRLW